MNLESIGIELTSDLKELILKLKEIKALKADFVKAQKYEEAARTRNDERKCQDEILTYLKKQGVGEFITYSHITHDLFLIFDGITEEDSSFRDAVKRLPATVYQRMKLVKSIDEYTNGNLSITLLHKAIENSFSEVIKDLKSKIEKL